jgi:hypothetical protein
MESRRTLVSMCGVAAMAVSTAVIVDGGPVAAAPGQGAGLSATPPPFAYSVQVSRCLSDRELLTIKQVENGKSGTRSFLQTATAQWIEKGTLHSLEAQAQAGSFPDDEHPHSYSFPFKFSFPKGQAAKFKPRMSVKLNWLSANNKTIFTRTVSKRCF